MGADTETYRAVFRAPAWLGLLAAGVLGCGRLGYGGVGGDDGDAGPDAAQADAAIPDVTPFEQDLGVGPSALEAVARMPDGAIATAGMVTGSGMLGTVPLVSAGGEDVVVAVLEADGAVRWAARYGGSGDDEANGIGVAPDGTIFVTGVFSGSIDFGGGTLTATNHGTFVVSLDAAGTHQWSIGFGDSGNNGGRGLVATRDGEVVVTGAAAGVVDFGDGVATPASGAPRDAFIARYSNAGELRWAHRYGVQANNNFYGVVEDSAGNLYTAGMYQGPADFGNGPAPAFGAYDGIVLSLDAGGGYRWSDSWGGSGQDRARGIALVGDTLAVGGHYNGTIDLAVPAAPNGDALVAAYDTNGVRQWALGFGGDGCDQARALDSDGTQFLVGGEYADLDDGVHISTGGVDGFVLSVSPSGQRGQAVSFGGSLNDKVQSVHALGGAKMLVTGHRNESSITNANCVGSNATGVGNVTDGVGFVDAL